MKKKVFASDFDGTIYFYLADVKLPPENVEKVKEYQEAGSHHSGGNQQANAVCIDLVHRSMPLFRVKKRGRPKNSVNASPIKVMAIKSPAETAMLHNVRSSSQWVSGG